ncbi:hypothetical protein A3K73_08695 [Candidatus Pacearchaeota archaeon RBG_13_36_9]|nr:MAG: hypothetical protein A3K73_08695 [Candidatus Pacearchaeota archaeon RBG_13_36_9]
MAGKYSVVLNGRKREINAKLPDCKGADYSVDVTEFPGAYENIRGYENGLVKCLRETGLESTGNAIFSCSPMEDIYYFVYAKDSGIDEHGKQQVFILLKKGEVSLHFCPEITERRDEAELLANACVILSRVVESVESEEIYRSK